MSYILDALRKADAQRQRTRLPGLQAQPTAAAAEATAPAWRSPIAWVLAGGLLVAMLALAWPGSQTAPSLPPAPVSAPPVAAAPALAPAEPAPQTAALAATTIQPAPPPPRPAAEPPQRPPARAAAPHEPAPTRKAPAPVAAASPAAGAASAPGKAAPESGTPPPGAPKLAITGGVYSADPAQRLLIVGGQVFNEGSEVAPGVVLEQVRAGQALLSYQGQRFTVRY